MSGAKLLDFWSPPDGAGSPVACLATTFTLEADFFSQDCLSRFLSLSMITGEGDAISSIAALLEEEERLSEAQVSVLVDRSSPAETRNLRWTFCLSTSQADYCTPKSRCCCGSALPESSSGRPT